MSGTITRDEWLKALDAAGLVDPDDQDAITVSEFAEMMALNRQTAARRLEQLVEKGQAIRTKKRCLVAERWLALLAYRLVTQPAKRKK